MSATATILHADLDAFYASVEQRDNPELRGRPVLVGGGGVVLAASYEAKAAGVRTAMSGYKALQICPDAVLVHPRMSVYTAASRAVFDVFHDTTPLVEGISIDEAFLDVGGLRRIAGSPEEIAVRLRRQVRDKVGLAITVGVARSKFLAKVASAVAKPDGLLVVPAGTELEFLHPLPVERLWGVGKVTSVKLRGAGIFTVGDVAQLSLSALGNLLGGASGRHLHALSLGLDPRSVQVGRRRGSIGSQRALGRFRTTNSEIDAVVVSLVDRVTRRLRSAARRGRTVTLRLRFEDFSRITRSHTLTEPTDDTELILTELRALVAGVLPMIAERGLTLLGMAVGNLDGDPAVQLELPFDGAPPGALDAAVDRIRDRFGTRALSRAGQLGRDPGMTVPMLPD